MPERAFPSISKAKMERPRYQSAAVKSSTFYFSCFHTLLSDRIDDRLGGLFDDG